MALNEDVARFQEALAQEFHASTTDSEKAREIVEKGLYDLAREAIERARHLVMFAESESVQADMTKFVIKNILPADSKQTAESELAALVSKLTKKNSQVEVS